ncbi:MAG: redoxin domain-containing protein [Pirellulales bacterium]
MRPFASRAALTALLLIAYVGARPVVAQQNPHGQLPVTTIPQPYLLLIRDRVVHDDLRLNEAQRTSLRELNDELDAAIWSMRNKSAERNHEMTEQAITTARSRVAEILTPEQQRRLDQIQLWTLGTRAFLGDRLPEALALSPEQRTEIRGIVEKSQAAVAALRERLQSGESRAALEKESQTIQRDEQQQIFAVLTPEQEQQWIAQLGQRIDVSQLGRVKFKAPRLQGDGPWINGSPLRQGDIRGQVVALHFYAFACINCQRNLPWYRGWWRDFQDEGLVVLGIHTPEINEERDVAKVRREAAQAELSSPILIDNDKQNWDAWGNSMWPSVYLIDKQGYVRYWWYGELNWQGAEGEKLLRQRLGELLAEKP